MRRDGHRFGGLPAFAACATRGPLVGLQNSGTDRVKEADAIGVSLEIILNEPGIVHFQEMADRDGAEIAWNNGYIDRKRYMGCSRSLPHAASLMAAGR
ncbi:hypothetical protein CKO32_08965 [Afifella marina DSM 2698]|uniref:Uncharacterized protein n=2 Tax=Afifella marina TaxID=1080 RepID=A0A1G5NJX1_AFIMA|nr:hypothetical protein [Afifella marina DSM 2698]MBK5916236.1 hypothetical protein [Afifella marina]RAI21572.1 hypothetical protein CH311_06010 [Afifella marina DSM 2698]SCZ37715.1 hypothetical protein SAMN03080610_02241 [Afifella marina DSM 2698]